VSLASFIVRGNHAALLPAGCFFLLCSSTLFGQAPDARITSGQSAEANQKPNILMIVADDLGYSDLGCYGGEIDTPQLDRLAENGMRLTRFYNTGRCCPSRVSILTGQYPHRVGVGHKVEDLGLPGYRGRVSDEALTIAQVLKTAGYRSFISGKWHLGTPDPCDHGFDEFYGTLVSAQTFWDPDHYVRTPAGRKKISYAPGEFYGTDAVTDHAIEFLSQARTTPDQPWFLYLAYHAPHFPLQAPAESIAKYADTYHVGWDAIRERRLSRMKQLGIVPTSTKLTPRSRYWDFGEYETGINPAWMDVPAERRMDSARRMAIYAAMIDRIDQNVGRVIEDLRFADEFSNTLVIFMSDNGACAEWDPYGFDISSSNQNILHRGPQIETMGGPGTFHSAGSAWANASNTPWRLQKHYNHEGGIASPCIIHWPGGRIRRGAIEDQPAHIIDLMPTMVQLTGARYTSKLDLVGESLLPLMHAESHVARTLYFEHEGNRAVHDGKWKLVALKDQPWELYDVELDRTELNDLAREHPGQVKRLAAMWDQWAEANQVTPLPTDYGVEYLGRPSQYP
tara:strand:+ start:82210 stop:83907 length:1698 start_codon:yes stop_codon:yes gene_type:complete